MKIYKRIAVLLLCMLAAMVPMLRCMPTASARAESEKPQKGSITVTMIIAKPVTFGGSLTLYRVGEVSESGDSFVPTGKFTAWGDSFGDITADSAALAEKLADWAANQTKLERKTKLLTKDSKGNFTVTFDDLDQGLYLLVQKNAATGYNKVRPFLVTVPYEGKYDVNANSKMEPAKPTSPSTSTTPYKPGTRLPQTGQLNWPVPVMVILGMTLFAIGWVLRFRKRDDNAQ